MARAAESYGAVGRRAGATGGITLTIGHQLSMAIPPNKKAYRERPSDAIYMLCISLPAGILMLQMVFYGHLLVATSTNYRRQLLHIQIRLEDFVLLSVRDYLFDQALRFPGYYRDYYSALYSAQSVNYV